MQRPQSTADELEASWPLKGFVRLYQSTLKAERKSAKTISVYTYVLRRFEDWFHAKHGKAPSLSDLTALAVREFLADAQDAPKWQGHPTLEGVNPGKVSGATIHQYVRSLKTFGAWVEREELLPRNPLSTVKLPKVDQTQLQPLSEEEERILLSNYSESKAGECRTKAIMLLMLDTGLRLSEVVNLKADDVDLDNGFLLVMGKGRKERTVPFGFTTEKVLRRYETFFRPDPALPTIDTFFLSPDGYSLTTKGLTMVFVRARKRTGITRLHAHLLRHTYGVRAQEGNMPSITLQHYMGHASSKTTERYVHVAQSEKLKRARGYSPIDQLGVRVRAMPPRPNRRGGR